MTCVFADDDHFVIKCIIYEKYDHVFHGPFTMCRPRRLELKSNEKKTIVLACLSCILMGKVPGLHTWYSAASAFDYALALQTSLMPWSIMQCAANCNHPKQKVAEDSHANEERADYKKEAKRKTSMIENHQKKRVKIVNELMEQTARLENILDLMAEEAEQMVTPENLEKVTEQDRKKMEELEANADKLEELVAGGHKLVSMLSSRPLELLC